MAHTIWCWVRDNKDSLIALGSLVVGALALFVGGKIYQKAKRGSVVVGDSADGATIQPLSMGDGSTAYQASQITVHHGITAADAIAISQKTFDDNAPRLTAIAAETATARAVAFTRELIPELERRNPGSLHKIQDPGYLLSVLEAQKQFAASGDLGLQATLIGLLADLTKAAPRSFVEIALREAMNAAPRMTLEQMQILALIFVLSNVRWEVLYQIDQLSRFASDYLEPLLVPGVSNANNYSHLSSLGCIELSPGAPRELVVFFMTHWRTLLSKGIPKDRVENINDGTTHFWTMFMPLNEDGSLLRLRYQSNEQIQQAASALGISQQTASMIFGLDSEYMFKGAEATNLIKSLHPAIDRLWTVWALPNSPLARSYLTTLGSTLAHAQLSAMGRDLGPLNLG